MIGGEDELDSTSAIQAKNPSTALSILPQFAKLNFEPEKEDSVSIHCLPDKILLRILREFRPHDLYRCRAICRRWYGIVRESFSAMTEHFLCDSMEDSGSKISVEQAIAYLQFSGENLQSLTLNMELDPRIFKELSDFRQLTRLVFEEVDMTEELALCFSEMSPPNLQELCVQCVGEGYSERCLNLMLTNLPNLNRLELFGCYEVTGKSIISCLHESNLKYLRISGCSKIHPIMLVSILHTFQNTLETLKLDYYAFRESGGKKNLPVMNKLEKFELLDSEEFIEYDGGIYEEKNEYPDERLFVKFLKASPNLKSLKFKDFYISYATHYFPYIVKFCPELETLELSLRSQHRDPSLGQFGQLKNLRTLIVGSVADGWVESLAECRSVRTLSLQCSALTDRDVLGLLHKMRRLKKLNLWGCRNVSSALVEQYSSVISTKWEKF